MLSTDVSVFIAALNFWMLVSSSPPSSGPIPS